MNSYDVVILAGGESSRFYPFNYGGNKSLISLCGKSLLMRTLEKLRDIGCKKIVIVEDSKKSISQILEKEQIGDLDLQFLVQKDPLGMGDALLLAKDYVSSDFFVISPYHFEFAQVFEDFIHAKKNPSDLVILTKNDADVSQFGAVSISNGKITVHEKKKDGNPAKRIVSMYFLNKTFLEVLAAQKTDHYSFENAISQYEGGEIVLLDTKQETVSLKFPWDIENVKNKLLSELKSHICKTAKIAKTAQISGTVYVDDLAVIDDFAVIKGPCYIGKNAYIGTNALIRNGSCIEADVVVGAGMEVRNSVLMKGVTTHSGFIGDSVIAEKTKLAAGFTTANVRLDRGEIFAYVKNEKINTHKKRLGCFIGCNSSIGIQVGTMPGILIGNSVTIGPGTTVSENVESNATYYTESKKIIKK